MPVCSTSTSTLPMRGRLVPAHSSGGWVVAYVPDFEVMHVGGAHSLTSAVKSYSNLIRSHINRYYFVASTWRFAVQVFRLVMSVGAGAPPAAIRRLVARQSGPPAGSGAEGRGLLEDRAARCRGSPEELPEGLRRESTDFEFVRSATRGQTGRVPS